MRGEEGFEIGMKRFAVVGEMVDENSGFGGEAAELRKAVAECEDGIDSHMAVAQIGRAEGTGAIE